MPRRYLLVLLALLACCGCASTASKSRALRVAVDSGDSTEVARLLSKGADPSFFRFLDDPLYQAMKNNQLEIATMLIEGGARARDHHFQLAIDKDYEEILILFLDARPRPSWLRSQLDRLRRKKRQSGNGGHVYGNVSMATDYLNCGSATLSKAGKDMSK